jgi:WD40 repeat protein
LLKDKHGLALDLVIATDLRGARLTGGRWPFAKLVATRLDPDTPTDCDFLGAGAALPDTGKPDFFTSFAHTCNSVAWHPTRPILATGHLDGTARLWHPESGRELRMLVGHGGFFHAFWTPACAGVTKFQTYLEAP